MLKKPSRRNRITVSLVAAAAVAALVLAVAVIAGRGDPNQEPAGPPATTAVQPTTPPDVGSGRVVADFEAQLGADFGPFRAVPDDDGLWVPLGTGSDVMQLDPVTLAVVRTVPSGLSTVFDAVPDGDTVWFAGETGVAELEPGAESGEVVPGLIGTGGWGVAVEGGALWAVNFGLTDVHRVDIATGEKQVIPMPTGIWGIASAAGRVWVTMDDGTVMKVAALDPSTGATTLTADMFPSEGKQANNTFATEDGVWVAGGGGGAWMQEVRNDGTVGPFVELDGDWADGMAADADGIWVAVRFGTSVYLVDPATGGVIEAVSVRDRTAGVAVLDGALVVASYDANVVERIPRSG